MYEFSLAIKQRYSPDKPITVFSLNDIQSQELSEMISLTVDKPKAGVDGPEYKPVTESLFDKIAIFYDDKIKTTEKYIDECKEKIDELEHRIATLSSREIYDRVAEEIEDNKFAIDNAKSEIEDYHEILSKFEFAKDMLILNMTSTQIPICELLYTMRYL